ncbi:hypothetical protein B566_EDAN005050 [Ephemera danica]|nr:hypothetical protein B566_EDAN005050 [Ephemera danica]
MRTKMKDLKQKIDTEDDEQGEAKLHPFEISAYFAIWISSVGYSVYKVYSIGRYFQHNTYTEDFSAGWWWHSKKDTSDYEWNLWKPLLLDVAPWWALNLVGAEFCRWLNLKLLPLWYIFVPSMFLIQVFGAKCFLSLLLQPGIFYLIALKSPYKTVTWTVGLVILTMLNFYALQDWFDLPDHLRYLLVLSQGWIHLRSLSYCLDVQSGTAKPTSFLHLLAYCFYLPLVLFGPVVLYSDFRPSMDEKFTPWTRTRFLSLLGGLLRYSFWMLVMDVWLHLIYSNALALQPKVVWKLDSWTLYGLGYCLGQYFMIKYTVVYGLPGVLARAEGVKAPAPPKCIGRIHLYSEMWRTFDQGLYFFLSRYIYTPVAKERSSLGLRIFASFLCFGFVYLWHGKMLYILIWSALNFLGVITEVTARKIASTSSFQAWQNRWLSPRGARRFHALIASPLLYMSALQVSIEVKSWELRNNKANKVKNCLE